MTSFLRRHMLGGALIVAGFPLIVAGQTQVDLSSQARRIDFSAASSTKPVKTGTSLPPTCQAGDMYLRTDAPAGGNIYACISPNTWAAQGGGGGGVAVPGSEQGEVLGWDTGTGSAAWFSFGSLFSITGRSVDLATEVVPQYLVGTTVPSSCSQWGLFFFDTDASAGSALHYCDGSGFRPVGGGGGASEIILRAEDARFPATNPASYNIQTSSNLMQSSVLVFGLDKVAVFEFYVPESYSGATTLHIYGITQAAEASYEVQFRSELACIDDTEVFSSKAWATAEDSADEVLPTTDDTAFEIATTLSNLDSMAASDHCFLRLTRVAITDGNEATAPAISHVRLDW